MLGACTHGTSGWLLQERAGIGGEGGGAGEAGESSAGASGAAEAGAAGEGGGGAVEPAPRCPTRFSAQCSPKIIYNNLDTTSSGALFEQAIPDPSTTLSCITQDVCNILYRKADEIRSITQITLLIEDYDGVSETYGSNGESTIHMSSRYMQQVVDSDGDLASELRGILYYQGTNIYQFDGGDGTANAWIVEGVADYVRHTGGFLPDNQRMPGGKYNDGNATTGFFLVWLDTQYTDFVYELNQSLNPATTTMWTTGSFMDITGKSVDDLWAAYQQSL